MLRAARSLRAVRLAPRACRTLTSFTPPSEVDRPTGMPFDSALPAPVARTDSLKDQITFNMHNDTEPVAEDQEYDDEPEESEFMNIPPVEDPLLRLFAGMIMKHGHKQKAHRTVSRTLLHLHALVRAPPLPILRDGLLAIAPVVSLVRVDTSRLKHIMKPVPLTERRSLRTAISWLMEECGHPGKLRIEERFAREIIDILDGKSKLLKKKEEVHIAAMLNKAHVQRSRRV